MSALTCLIMTSLPATPDLGVACRRGAWGAFEYPPASSYGPTRLADFEFVWVISGEATCTIVTSDEERMTEHLTPGRLLLARPGSTHTYAWSEHGPTVHGFVHFQLGPAARALAPSWPRVRPIPPGSTAAALCHELVRLAPTPGAALDAADAATMDAACSLLLRLFVTDATTGYPEQEPAYLSHLAAWLSSRWRSGPMSAPPLAHLAAAVNVSPGHLSRLTRTAFGIGPVAAVEVARLDRAAALLTRSNLTVAQVARVCGFSSPFYLSRRFRSWFGRPPTQYRRDPAERPASPGQSAEQSAALAGWCARTQSS
jgi:AraC family transcriptional regulator